jgi:hypothetical protein
MYNPAPVKKKSSWLTLIPLVEHCVNRILVTVLLLSGVWKIKEGHDGLYYRFLAGKA